MTNKFAKQKWKSITKKVRDKYGGLPYNQYPKPKDPINGLVMASGHYNVHLAFFFTILFVKQANKEIICNVPGEDGEMTTRKFEGDLNDDITFLRWMHLVCFVF